ncbi:MAG TPA: dihydrofolate reductase family protein [Parachlamydiaceae bacterium]|nr:dihydrofolate reductase family protein [Parachlamydiaceae bacterium]
MTKIVLYIATSKDGFIADEKGSVDWLPQTAAETGGQDYGYQEFYDSVDSIAIGRKTYEQILGFGDWPYPGKQSYIFTRKPMQTSNKEIEFISDDIPGFIQEIETRNIKKLWMVGGSELIEAFYTQGRIDEFIVTVFPKVLKKGIPLMTLTEALQRDELIKLNSTDFGDGVLQVHYIQKNKK